MEPTKAIEAAVEATHLSRRALSRLMGRNPNYIASVVEQSRRKGGGVNVSTLAEIAKACGYDLALVPCGRLPEGGIVVDPAARGGGASRDEASR